VFQSAVVLEELQTCFSIILLKERGTAISLNASAAMPIVRACHLYMLGMKSFQDQYFS